MFRGLLVAALLGVLSAPASADFRTVNRAYEAQLSGFRLPVTTSGTLGFRQCAGCDVTSLRVTPQTRYLVNGQDVDLREFRREVLQVRERAGRAVIVKHDLENDTVTSVSIRL